MIIVENIDEFKSKYGKIKGWFLSIAWTLFFIVAESCVDALMVSLALKSSKIVFRAFEILNISDLGFIDYFTANGVSPHRIGSDYKDAMRKSHTKGVIILLHNFSEKYVTQNMGFEKTRRTNNGIALFFHENTGTFQLIDMEKVRAAHFEQLQQRSTSSASTEPADNTNIPQISEMSSEILTRPVRITVNGKERVCKNGILEGFKNAVKIIDSLAEKIRSIVEENKKLRDKLQHKNKQKSNEVER